MNSLNFSVKILEMVLKTSREKICKTPHWTDTESSSFGVFLQTRLTPKTILLLTSFQILFLLIFFCFKFHRQCDTLKLTEGRNMSSLRALKRKSLQKHKNISKDHLQLSKSTENLQSSNNKVNSALRRSKSESDISNISPSKNTKHYGKSERNLESLFITSTPCSTLISSPENMQSSSFSIIADSDQIKIPIIGYEVMEERSRFTVRFFTLEVSLYLI